MSTPDEIRPLARDNLSAFDAAPQVSGASQPWVLPLGIIGAVALGVLVFAGLNASRVQQERERAAAIERAEVEAPPPVAPAPPAPHAEEAFAEPLPAPLPATAEPDVDARLRAPALVIDLSEPAEARAEGAATAQGVANAIAGEAMSGDERFAARFGSGAPRARARLPSDPRTTVPQGAIITAVLETAINSDLPGYVRALVSRDVLSFDGSTVLAPRGSRLIGQYRSGVSIGQSRAFVIWTRLVRPDGVTVDLNSPGADALGRGGLEGETDRHFFRRFGGAMLLTLLGGATAAAVADSDGSVIVDVTRVGGDAASTAVREASDISPTIRVPQGTPIRIFVARDLDFSGVPGAAP